MWIGSKPSLFKSRYSGQSVYWTLALGLMTISSGSYCLVPYSQQVALSIGNLSAICAAFSILLLIRSWNTPVTGTYLSCVGVTLVIFTIAFQWLLVQPSSFSLRVYVTTGFYIVPVLLALLEL